MMSLYIGRSRNSPWCGKYQPTVPTGHGTSILLTFNPFFITHRTDWGPAIRKRSVVGEEDLVRVSRFSIFCVLKIWYARSVFVDISIKLLEALADDSDKIHIVIFFRPFVGQSDLPVGFLILGVEPFHPLVGLLTTHVPRRGCRS